MAKASISIPAWARAFVLDPKKFAVIDTHGGAGWTFAGPKSDIVWIGVPRDAADLRAFVPPAARQTYLVFPSEYRDARRSRPISGRSIRPTLKPPWPMRWVFWKRARPTVSGASLTLLNARRAACVVY